MVKIKDKNGNHNDLKYKQGKMVGIQDNFNRKMTLAYNKRNGLLERVTGVNGQTASYRYDAKGRLVYSKDAEGNAYRFAYDNRHNMTKITYSDKTSMDIKYHGRKLFENVASVKERTGDRTTYGYSYDKKDNGHFKITVKEFNKKKKLISKNSYEYFMRIKETGEEWTYKLITDFNGDRTETVYTKCCGTPLTIKRNGRETAFKYDKKGRVVEKSTPIELTKLNYDQKAGKVKRVTKYSKINKKSKPTWSSFKYDGKGNLVLAKNSRKQGVRLFYDRHGRIKSMIDQNKRRINFKYNENSKPIEISDPKLGAIKVSYTNSGQVAKVQSSAGRRVALEVTTAFQNLLDIIRPAGVTLSF